MKHLDNREDFVLIKKYKEISKSISNLQDSKTFEGIKNLSLEAKKIFEKIDSNLPKISTAFFESHPKDRQDLIKEELLNWSPEKGDPYDYDTFGISERKPEFPEMSYEILDEQWKEHKGGKSLLKLDCNHHLKTIEKMPTDLYRVIMAANKKNGLVTYLSDMDKEKLESFDVLISYPFEKTVKVTIPAKFKMYTNNDEDRFESSIGYYIKQIANAYGHIYKEMVEEVGIYGHGFGDLYLETMEFVKDGNEGIIKLSIGS